MILKIKTATKKYFRVFLYSFVFNSNFFKSIKIHYFIKKILVI